MAAATMASSAVEPAATAAMEATSTATVESIATVEASVIATTDETVRGSAAVAMVAVLKVSATSVVAMSFIAAAIEAATIVTAMVPRTGTDEDAADEVVRSVVTVRSAGVRRVAIVTVSADRRRADGAVYGTYSHAHAKLRVGAACGKKQNSKQSNIFQVTHSVPLVPACAPGSKPRWPGRLPESSLGKRLTVR